LSCHESKPHTKEKEKGEKKKHSITLHTFKVSQKATRDEKRYNPRGTTVDGIGFNNGP
jgi:hypothetical protein